MKQSSIDFLIEKVKKNLPDQLQINRDDVVEWVWESINLIGISYGFANTTEYINIANYVGIIPAWVSKIDSVVLLSTTATLVEIIKNKEDYTKGVKLSLVDNNGKPVSMTTTENQYTVTGRMIKTNVKTGVVKAECLSIPLSPEGEPTIPEEIHYINAVMWYITYKYLWRATLNNPQMYAQIAQKAEQEWYFYNKAAKSNALIQTEDGLRKLVTNYLRLLPNLNDIIK